MSQHCRRRLPLIIVINKMESGCCVEASESENIDRIGKERPKKNKNVKTQNDDNFEDKLDSLQP